MSNLVIVGAQWGDEGKGKLVDLLTESEKVDIVARFQGGHNAGHTIVVNGNKTVLRLTPSGILNPDVEVVIGNGVVVCLETLRDELAALESNGVHKPFHRLRLSKDAPIILPYHIAVDRLREIKLGTNQIGTTGKGIGPAYEDKVARRAIKVGDLRDANLTKEKLFRLAEYHNFMIEKYYGGDYIDPSPILNSLYHLGERFYDNIANVSEYMNYAIQKNKRIIFEGAQAALLDVDHGTYPYVTSSNCVSAQAAIGTGIAPQSIKRVLGVTKAYTTRVGNGPFPSEALDEIANKLRTLGNEYGSVTGRPRRCGWIETHALRRSAQLNGFTSLAIMKIDVLDTFETVSVFDAGYEFVLPGWSDKPCANVTKYDELHPNAQKFVTTIEDLTGIPVSIVSTGQGREHTIMRHNPFYTHISK